MRALIWKLADEAFCLADWEGFREAALPGLYPGGALRWVSALLGTTGLSDAGWWVPYVVLMLGVAGICTACAWKRVHAWGIAVAPLLLVMASVLHVGTRVWRLTDPSFLMTNLLGMLVVAVLFVLLRGRVLVAGVVCALAYVPCGAYALVAGGVVLLDGLLAWGGGRGATALPMGGGGATALGLLVATPGLVAAGIYGDVATGYALGRSQSMLNGALLEPFGFWPVLAFGLLGWELIGKAPRVRLAVVGVCCALVFVGRPEEDLRAQFRMERCVREGRFEEALAVSAADPNPLRMSLAYRVLALGRTGRLETELFARPFTSFHRTSPAEELKMDGQDLFFDYGLLLPARQRAMENVAEKGWRPGYLRLMGDVAFLTGERALAARNWRQLARCPFRGAFARRRLAGLRAGKGLEDAAFADLRPVAELYATWCETVGNRSEPPFYFLRDANAENFIYGRMLTVRSRPTPGVTRLILAAYLLEKDTKALVASRGMMEMLCPEGPWPKYWQQGTLAYLGACPPAERDAIVATLREGVFTAEELTRYDSFVRDIQGGATNGVDLVARYGDTYYFYDAFTR